MSPTGLRTSRSVPLLRVEAASSSSDSSSDSEDSTAIPRESSPEPQQQESSVSTVLAEHFNRQRALTHPPPTALTLPRKPSLPLTRTLRTIPSSLTLPNLRHKFSKSALDSLPHELTEGYFPPSTPPENKRASADEDWNPNLAIDVLEKSLLKTYDKNKPIDRSLYHPLFRMLEFTRGLIAEYQLLEEGFEERVQRTVGEALGAMERGFEPVKEVYLDEIGRIEGAVVERYGVEEAVRIREGTLLMGDLRRRPHRVRERRVKEWKMGWDPNDVESDPDEEYRTGRDLVPGKDLVESTSEGYGRERRDSESSENGFTHEKSKAGRGALRSIESGESLNKVLREDAGDLSYLDNPSGRYITDDSPLALALGPQDSQAILGLGHDFARGRTRTVEADTLEWPSARRGILRTADSDDTLVTSREHRSRHIQFAEGGRLERGRSNRRRTHPSLRIADSQETLVEREAADDMTSRLARAGFI